MREFFMWLLTTSVSTLGTQNAIFLRLDDVN